MKNVLVIGSGGREHAIAKAFGASRHELRIIVAPGNAGIAEEFETLELNTLEEVVSYCVQNPPDMVFVGPEKALAEGFADELEKLGIPCIGPSQKAARIESSKIFAKELMQKYGIPTASFFFTYDENQAIEYIENHGTFPLVIKADGLAGGKGVHIVQDKSQGIQAVQLLMSQTSKGVVIEQYLQGWEVSLFAFSDGENYCSTVFSQDHKQLYDHDQGPNTGGMGAYSPVPEAEPWRNEVEEQIIAPVLRAMNQEGCPFVGVLYCGLMITKDGPKVVEFNCRLGDPEAQAVLPLLETDFYDLCQAIVNKQVDQLNLSWKPETCVAVVMASRGYPGFFQKGYPIHIDPSLEAEICYAGVASPEGELVTSGGRVLTVLSLAESKEQAHAQVYKELKKIHFQDQYYRKDIGLRDNKI
jgi:phosphoribosylamine--glycine ligase